MKWQVKTVGDLMPSEICNEIVEMIWAEKGIDAEIETKHNNAYSSIKFWGIHSLRVKCGRKNYIGLKNSFEHIWNNDKSIKIERIQSDELWSRVSFNSQEELKNLYSLFLQLYDEAYLLVSIEIFSCCSRFTQCSDEKVCIQPDKRLALGCQYRKNLTSGKIFYGKNCNV
jgi:hypothetical protein